MKGDFNYPDPSYYNCPWCHGRRGGCLMCKQEREDAAFRAAKPIFTARTDDPREMEDAKFVIGADALNADIEAGRDVHQGILLRSVVVELRRITEGRAAPTPAVEPTPEPADPPEYFYYSTLLKRGWTQKLIRTVLGDEDKETPNPHNRSGPPSRLFLRTRVIEAEASDAFKSSQTDREKRSEAAKRAVDTKREKILSTMESLNITLPELSQQELIEHAVQNRNAQIPDWKIEQGDVRLCQVEEIRSWPEADAFRDRICVNFLRHGATSYDRILRILEGKIGKDDAQQILREKVFAAIAESYPYLREEVVRQLEARRF
jgi:hypothetical protein